MQAPERNQPCADNHPYCRPAGVRGLIIVPAKLCFNVFMLSSVVGRAVPITTIFKGVLWFLAMDIVTLGILIALPSITLFLPDLYEAWMSYLRNAELGSFEAIGLWLTGNLPVN